MFTTTTYKGTLDGKYIISCDHITEGMIIEEEVTVYHPDEGKIFIKDGEYYSAVVLQDGETIEGYQEVDEPEEPTI